MLTETIVKESKARPFVYISNRVNSYAVDPRIYPHMSNVKNMMGFAVVSENENCLRNAELEKLFYSKSYGIFRKMDDAKIWKDQIIKEFKTL